MHSKTVEKTTNKHFSKNCGQMIKAWLNWYLEMENLLSPARTGFIYNWPTNQKITILSQRGQDWQKRNNDLYLMSA